MTQSQHGLEYTLRRSTRAKSLRLQIHSARGLEVVVPDGYDLSKIPAFLSHHQAWIQKHLKKYKPSVSQAVELPEELTLFAIHQTWKITYVPLIKEFRKSGNKVEAKDFFPGQLMVIGNVHQKKAVRLAILKWLTEHAKIHLLPWLKKLSEKTGISYHDAIIRYTKSRWGSCTSKKRISLSPSLLFLTPHLTEHIMLHELCHTVHLDHSAKFWHFFEKHCPDALNRRKQVSKANQYLPAWLERLT